MESKLHILVIEDEKHINDFICKSLKDYKVSTAYTGKNALEQIASSCPDLILLDLGLPDMDGLEIIRSVRTWSAMPILIISARTQEVEKVAALDAGADDYLTKPFGTGELLARIRTAVRHSTTASTQNGRICPYQSQQLSVDYEKRLVTLNGDTVHLTPVEYKIVACLAQSAGKVITYDTLIRNVWGPYADDNNRILRVNMANIRRKLERNPAAPEYIFTELGIGYRMAEEDA